MSSKGSYMLSGGSESMTAIGHDHYWRVEILYFYVEYPSIHIGNTAMFRTGRIRCATIDIDRVQR